MSFFKAYCGMKITYHIIIPVIFYNKYSFVHYIHFVFIKLTDEAIWETNVKYIIDMRT